VTGYGVRFPAGGRDFFLLHRFQTVSESIQPSIQWEPGVLSPSLKLPGSEDDHLPPSSAEVKNGGSISLLLHTSSWRGANFIKHRDNFHFRYWKDRSGKCHFVSLNPLRMREPAYNMLLKSAERSRPWGSTRLHEQCCLLRCNIVQSCISSPAFRKNILPPHSKYIVNLKVETARSSKTSVNIYRLQTSNPKRQSS
jgi:hypothetical protein